MFKSIIVGHVGRQSGPRMGSWRSNVENSIGFSHTLTKNNMNRKHGPVASFFIGKSIASKAGIRVGDKIDILFDAESKTGKMVKNSNGLTVTPSQSRNVEGFVVIGNRYFDFPYNKSTENLKNVSVVDGEIIFSWPTGMSLKEARENITDR